VLWCLNDHNFFNYAILEIDCWCICLFVRSLLVSVNYIAWVDYKKERDMLEMTKLVLILLSFQTYLSARNARIRKICFVGLRN